MNELKKSILVISLLKNFSAHTQKRVVKTIYNKQKNLKKYNDSRTKYENWMITHNINY